MSRIPRESEGLVHSVKILSKWKCGTGANDDSMKNEYAFLRDPQFACLRDLSIYHYMKMTWDIRKDWGLII